MNARELLNTLKHSLENETRIEDKDTFVTPIHGNAQRSKAVVIIEIEGIRRLFEVQAKCIGDYSGIMESGNLESAL